MTMTDTEAKAQIIATDGFVRSIEWPDPTPKMLDTILFDTIWRVIKSWDINVPNAYSGYMGATGNHARAIYDALAPLLEATEARHAAELREQAGRFSEAASLTLRMLTPYPLARDEAEDILTPFILPAPDPLVEAFASLPVGFAGCVDGADALRAAMQARGYEWRKIGEAGE